MMQKSITNTLESIILTERKKMAINKRVELELVGLDGNAFSLMGAFRAQAQKEGWTQAEIKEVLNECMSGDYNHLLQTLMEHTYSPDDE
jgi:hypothetical protein